MNKMDDDKKISIKLSWFPFWMAGFLFTVGYGGVDPLINTFPWWKQIFCWIASYILWPLLLGAKLGGG